MSRIPVKDAGKRSVKKAGPGRRKKQVEPVKNRSLGVYLTLFTVAVLGILVVIAMNRKASSPPQIASSELSLVDSFLEAQVLKVASKFRCFCGTCGGTPLEDCSCEAAVAERQFIRDKLKAGLDVEQIIAQVNRTYGWLKPEFESEYGGS
ncbi:MAG: hypothetical protein Kow0042_01760 [Calditrichia bacterium]